MRRVVIAAGVLATLVGLVMLMTLPWPWRWRLLLTSAWLALNLRQLLILVSSHRRCHRIRIDASGEITVTTPDGCCFAATLAAGSVVLARLAWLRFESADGVRCAELFRGRSSQSQHWRRLQVIWRHLGAPR